ncbi:hypothetical protein EV359DRAFT_59611 [Lentinula novae-zelandiae]|nr:hypothetical protein EV359DRAFT_59611 [Lentinula novae-zelandiae]
MSSTPQLGSLAIQAPSLTPQIVHVSPETCLNLSMFKGARSLKQHTMDFGKSSRVIWQRCYEVIEHSMIQSTCVSLVDVLHNLNLTQRLNRTAAFMHDQERQKACSRLWQELVSNWSRRTELIEYCVGVVDKSNEEKQEIVDSQTSNPSEVRKARAEKYSQEVKVMLFWLPCIQ